MRHYCILTSVCILVLVFGVSVLGQEQVEADLSDGTQAAVPVGSDSGAAAPAASMLRLIRFSGSVPGVQGQPLAGAVGITFALYAEQEGGAPLWLETQNVSLDPQGRYTALLGATSNEGLPLELFTSAEARWLGIQVQGQAERPRVLLVAVPYALRAEEAQRLAGREATEFLLAEQLESDVQEVVETKVVEEMEAQGLVVLEGGVTRAITDGASTFTDNNATQVVQVTQNGTGKAVKAVSTTGNTIEAESTSSGGTNFTLLGVNRSNGGRALFGFASATSGPTIAAAGRADSPLGIGFFGQALSVTGPTVAVQGEVRSPSGIAGLFANTAGGKLLLGKSSGAEVFGVDGSGGVGIGTGTPSTQLHIVTADASGIKLSCTGNFCNTTNAATIEMLENGDDETFGVDASGFRIRYDGLSPNPGALHIESSNGSSTIVPTMVMTRSTGRVGIGISSAPQAQLHVEGSGIIIGDFNETGNSGFIIQARNGTDNEFQVDDLGNVFIDGSVQTPATDLAEMVPVGEGETLEPGDVVAVDPAAPNRFRKSRQAYSPYVVGVVSTKPGVLLGEGDGHDEDGPSPNADEVNLPRIALALAGRVPVKVTLEGGAIQPGDPLTSASKPGYAMKATGSAAIIGTALEAFGGEGEGLIKMFVSPYQRISLEEYAALTNRVEAQDRQLAAQGEELSGLRAELVEAKKVLGLLQGEVRRLLAASKASSPGL